MIESLRYGVPAGLFLFALMVLQIWVKAEQLTLLRWAISLALVICGALYSYKQRNTAYFPYSYAWFSGFNVVSAAILTHGLLIMLMTPWLSESLGVDGWMGMLQVAFLEFIYQAGIGLLLLTLLAAVFYKKKKA